VLTNVFLVMLGGSIGALSRYGVSLLAAKLFGTRFPWGTLMVNLVGCFLIGLSFALADRGNSILNPSIRLFFVTGYLGALTTFSTYVLETTNAVSAQNSMVAFLNFGANNLLGVALVLLGMWVVKLR
jgi:fluoride exporter